MHPLQTRRFSYPLRMSYVYRSFSLDFAFAFGIWTLYNTGLDHTRLVLKIKSRILEFRYIAPTVIFWKSHCTWISADVFFEKVAFVQK